MSAQNLEKGKLFLKIATRVLLYGLKQIPGVGMALDLAEEFQAAVQELRKQQDQVGLEERLARIEEAMALTPVQAREAAREALAEERTRGTPIPAEREAALLDLLSALPATIRERTQTTLLQARRRGTAPATVIPVGEGFTPEERDAYYASLFPARRPRFQAEDRLPHGNVEWQLESLLGAGGFGEVWTARHRFLGEQWAVKSRARGGNTQAACSVLGIGGLSPRSRGKLRSRDG